MLAQQAVLVTASEPQGTSCPPPQGWPNGAVVTAVDSFMWVLGLMLRFSGPDSENLTAPYPPLCLYF